MEPSTAQPCCGSFFVRVNVQELVCVQRTLHIVFSICARKHYVIHHKPALSCRQQLQRNAHRLSQCIRHLAKHIHPASVVFPLVRTALLVGVQHHHRRFQHLRHLLDDVCGHNALVFSRLVVCLAVLCKDLLYFTGIPQDRLVFHADALQHLRCFSHRDHVVLGSLIQLFDLVLTPFVNGIPFLRRCRICRSGFFHAAVCFQRRAVVCPRLDLVVKVKLPQVSKLLLGQRLCRSGCRVVRLSAQHRLNVRQHLLQ